MTYSETDVAMQIDVISIRREAITEAFQYRYTNPDKDIATPIYVDPGAVPGRTGAYFYYEGWELDGQKLPPDEIQLHPAFHPPPIYLSPEQFVADRVLGALDASVREQTPSYPDTSSTVTIAQPAPDSPDWDSTWADRIKDGLVDTIDLLFHYQYPNKTVPVEYLSKYPHERAGERLDEMAEKAGGLSELLKQDTGELYEYSSENS